MPQSDRQRIFDLIALLEAQQAAFQALVARFKESVDRPSRKIAVRRVQVAKKRKPPTRRRNG